MIRRPPRPPLFPYTTLFRSDARRFVDTARLLEDLPRPITLLTGNDNFILESFFLGATGALIGFGAVMTREQVITDRKSTRLNSSHRCISYAVFCLKKKKTNR